MKNIRTIYEILNKTYSAYPKTELVYHNPFQLLISILMSAQSTDKQVNKITKVLRILVKKPEDIIKIWIENLENEIKSINYYKTKAKNIYNLSKIVLSTENQTKRKKDILNSKFENIFYNFDTILPCKFEDLINLPWVWQKTAMVFLNIIFDQPFVAVDTHVQRVCNRLWLLKTKNAKQTMDLLNSKLSIYMKKNIHHFLIYHGRYICKAKNPNCKICELSKYCKNYNDLK